MAVVLLEVNRAASFGQTVGRDDVARALVGKTHVGEQDRTARTIASRELERNVADLEDLKLGSVGGRE